MRCLYEPFNDTINELAAIVKIAQVIGFLIVNIYALIFDLCGVSLYQIG